MIFDRVNRICRMSIIINLWKGSVVVTVGVFRGIVKQLFLLVGISVLIGCATPRTEFFGMEVTRATTDAFTIKSQDVTGSVSYTYDKNLANPNITAQGSIYEGGTFRVYITNRGNSPIHPNYFLDRFTMVSKDLNWYELTKPDILYYPSEVINPGRRVYFSMPSPLGRDNVEFVIIELGGNTRLMLKEVPPFFETSEGSFQAWNVTGKSGEITGYDGVPFGAKLGDVEQYLNQLVEVDSGFEKVPLRSYYRYYITRDYLDKDQEKAQSEVALLFKRGKLFQIKDVFGGSYKTEAEVSRFIEPILNDLEQSWGTPNHRGKEKTTWHRSGVTAELILEMPDNSYGYPVVKLLIYKGDKALFPVF